MTTTELCDECGEPLGDPPVYDERDCTQFCCSDCADAWEVGDHDR